jgi:hypothetical protein
VIALRAIVDGPKRQSLIALEKIGGRTGPNPSKITTTVCLTVLPPVRLSLPSHAFFLDAIEETYCKDHPLSIYQKKISL